MSTLDPDPRSRTARGADQGTAPGPDQGAPAPPLGPHGQPCGSCGAPLAADQRYCLECGTRRPEARLAFLDDAGGGRHATVETNTTSGTAPGPRAAALGPGGALAAGVAILLLALGVGVLIGRAGDGRPATAAAPAITVNGGGGTAAPAAEDVAFTSDWPAGEEGWTVALRVLSKDGTQAAQVAQAKTEATGKGAPDIGALDSDEYPSLEGGSFVVYSGVFTTKGKAESALKGLMDDFPDARVVEVGQQAQAAAAGGGSSSGGGGASEGGGGTKSPAIKELDEAKTPEEAAKKSRALPKEVGTGGQPKPKDDKAPAGGGEFEAIG